MPTFEKTIFTNLGIGFVNDLNSAHSKLVSATSVYSSTDLSGMSDDDIKNMTDIANKELTANCDIIKIDNKQTKIRSTANNESLKQGVYIRSYATYVVDQDGNQTLFAIKVNTKPQFLPAFDGVNANAQSYGFNVGISQTDSVMFTKLSNLSVTHADLDVALSSKADVSTVTDLQSSISNVSNEVASNSAIASSFAAVNQSVSTNSIAISANSNNQASFNNSTTANNSSAWSAIASLSNSVNSNKSYIQTVENDNNSKEYISDHQSDFNTLSAANSTTASALSSAASSSDKKAESNAFRIFQAENKINTTYQNAVNTAKSYTDSNVTPIKPFANRDDALSAANASTVPMLAVYPNSFQLGKSIDVLGIYSYGNITLPDVSLNVTPGPNISLDGAWAKYNQNTNTLYYGGKFNYTSNIATGDTLMSINIKQLNMNDIAVYPNSNYYTVDTDTNRENLLIKSKTGGSNGGWLRLSNESTVLKYDGSLKPKLPSILYGYQNIVLLKDGDNLKDSKFTVYDGKIYYRAPGVNVLNGPSNNDSYIMQTSPMNGDSRSGWTQYFIYIGNTGDTSNRINYTNRSNDNMNWSTSNNQFLYAPVLGTTKDFINIALKAVPTNTLKNLTGQNSIDVFK